MSDRPTEKRNPRRKNAKSSNIVVPSQSDSYDIDKYLSTGSDDSYFHAEPVKPKLQNSGYKTAQEFVENVVNCDSTKLSTGTQMPPYLWRYHDAMGLEIHWVFDI